MNSEHADRDIMQLRSMLYNAKLAIERLADKNALDYPQYWLLLATIEASLQRPMKKPWESDHFKKEGCVRCGSKIIGHHGGIYGDWCCRCYVLAGNAPADWHSVCMSTWRELEAWKSVQNTARSAEVEEK